MKNYYTGKWIPVKKRKPRLMRFVPLLQREHESNGLFGGTTQTIYMGWRDRNEDGNEFWWADMHGELDNVTHWCDIPQSPKVGG